MLKKILRIVKKIILSFLLVYGYNLVIAPINMLVPLNIIVISYITILGIPAFLSIILISFLIY